MESESELHKKELGTRLFFFCRRVIMDGQKLNKGVFFFFFSFFFFFFLLFRV